MPGSDVVGLCPSRMAAVQHLALFVFWNLSLSETSGGINTIWEREKQSTTSSCCVVRSAEDAKRDAKQWAAKSEETDFLREDVELDVVEGDQEARIEYRSDIFGNATRLIDVFRQAIGVNQITAGSKEISTFAQMLYDFQTVALGLVFEGRPEC